MELIQPASGRRELKSFILLYGLMYAAFGVASPFWPRFFEERGVAPAELGMLLAMGTAARLVSGPIAGGIADRFDARVSTLAICIGLSALFALGLLRADGFPLLLAVSLGQAAVLAPVTTLADALASRRGTKVAGQTHGGFEYGWVRGAGSAAFVAGTLIAGQVVSATALGSVVFLHAGLLLAAALVTSLSIKDAPEPVEDARPATAAAADFRVLLHLPLFRRLLLVAALVLGSHAMHDAFAVIRWNAAGIGPGLASVLWSLSVASEVAVFWLIGPRLLARAGPAGAAAIAAAAGVLRWTVMAISADPLALVVVQPLHGLTFALLHLACMRLLVRIVPARLAASGQAIYAFAAASATGLMTLAAGSLYADFGAHAFFAMAVLCAAALPLTAALRERERI
jgi:PPP family 3-phenylpropionic acid transporter